MLAFEFLQTVIDQSLCYGIKSPDMDLYDFGFGNLVEGESAHLDKKEICSHILHVTCRFRVIWRTDERQINKYREDTPSDVFGTEVKRLIGMKVRRVGLSDKNDLFLDLGNCRLVFSTHEDGKESWRFFMADRKKPHLVAADSWIEFQGMWKE